MSRPWTPEDDARLRELYPFMRTSQLPAMFGRSTQAIRVRATNMHLRKDPAVSMRRQWHPDEDAVLQMLYADTPTDAVAAVLGRSLISTYQRARKLGIEKSEAYMAHPDACRLRRGDNVGAPYRFQKGHVPANKGLRRPGWSAGRMKETQFKKGQATNWKPVGSTRLVDGYVYRKVSDVRKVPWTVNWKPEHVLLWESANGPVPPGNALRFKDGKRLNIELANLELISRADLARRNSIHNLPPAIKGAIMTLGQLKRRIREKQNRGSAQPPVRNARGPARRGEADGHRARQGRRRSRAGDRGLGKGREHIYGNHGQ